jgi:hypothetical protein
MGKQLDDNDGKHIDEIIQSVSCSIHSAEIGVPCFHIQYGVLKGGLGPGICGPRIKKAGFNGEIQPSSLSQKAKGRKTTRS